MPKTGFLIDRDKILREIKVLAPKTPRVVRSTAVYERMRDPVLLRAFYQLKTQYLINSLSLEGASPPDVFVGRMEYPKVFIGPLLPPDMEGTEILGTPEAWVGKSIEEIVDMRTRLVRGMYKVGVKDVNHSGVVEATQELALAKGPVYVDALWQKKPQAKLKWDDHVQPFGPSAPIKKIEISGMKTDQKIEKVHNDTDLKAKDAMIQLYEKGVLVSKIQRSLSAGLFGIHRNRKFVPTRWSITATDDTLGKNLLASVKTYPTIDSYWVYELEALDNRWEILMMPKIWSYELIEAWYPGTIWNPEQYISMFSSAEGWHGRKEYAEIGGCYYSARLAIAEALEREKRQATAIVFRESHPGYIMPVGVWNVREHVRAALKTKPLIFDTLQAALNRVAQRLEIPIKTWIQNSEILQMEKKQRSLVDFVRTSSRLSS